MGVGKGGGRGSDDPPFLGQFLYISYIKCQGGDSIVLVSEC